MDPEWTSIRVRRETLVAIRAEVKQLLDTVAAGQCDEPEGMQHEPLNPKHLGLSMDAMLQLLLEARANHRSRRRSSKGRRNTDRAD